MRTDENGVSHPTLNDYPTTEGYLHIAGCPACRQAFDEGAVNMAERVRDEVTFADRMAQQSKDAWEAKHKDT